MNWEDVCQLLRRRRGVRHGGDGDLLRGVRGEEEVVIEDVAAVHAEIFPVKEDFSRSREP